MSSLTPAAPFVHAVLLDPPSAGDYSDELPALREAQRVELDRK